mgnify:FL=1
MKKELLYQFFEGTSSETEELAIKKWIEASPENKKVFLQERLTYDATLLTSPEKLSTKKVSFSKYRWKISTAAAIVALLIISGLYYIDFNINKTISYNTILVPPGQRINLILSDNSNVWLNANSVFKYPTKFSNKKRAVYLDGEAHFDVKSNDKSPFIVETDYGSVQATGTSFNVEAYSKHGMFETSLFEGKVKVQAGDTHSVTLLPNQNSTLSQGQLLVSQITDSDKYLWKNGLIAFNNNKLEEILSSLEKYFDIKIQIDSTQLPIHTYTGKFRQSDGVDYALRVLQKSIQFSYKRDDNSGIIHIK